MSIYTVSIAVPTYNRPELLKRALISIKNQTYLPDEVIVFDNATPGKEVDAIIDEFLLLIPNLRYYKQKENVGPGPNVIGCINYSSSDLFMWLADDDEISPSCLEELLTMFENIPGLASAVPRWHLFSDLQNFEIMPKRSFISNYSFFRISKYMFRCTDELFYGLHRREWLTRCNLKSYYWPNKNETLNLVYPFLLNMVIEGKVITTNNNNAYWRNYDYGVKYHGQKEKSTLSFMQKIFFHFRYLMRRFNLQILYLSKISDRLGKLVVIAFLPVSLLTILQDFISHFYNIISRKSKK